MDSVNSVKSINPQYRADLGPILEITTKVIQAFLKKIQHFIFSITWSSVPEKSTCQLCWNKQDTTCPPLTDLTIRIQKTTATAHRSFNNFFFTRKQRQEACSKLLDMTILLFKEKNNIAFSSMNGWNYPYIHNHVSILLNNNSPSLSMLLFRILVNSNCGRFLRVPTGSPSPILVFSNVKF